MSLRIPRYEGLFDGDFLVYRIGFACEEESRETAIKTLGTSLRACATAAGCKTYRLFFTGGRDKCFRQKRATIEGYKANRKSEKPKHYDVLRAQLQFLGAELVEGWEADDALPTYQHPNAVMIHVDKDIDTVPGLHFNPVKQLQYRLSPEQAEWNFWQQMIKGDATDNIRGLRGLRTPFKKVMPPVGSTELEYIEAIAPLYLAYADEKKCAMMKLEKTHDPLAAFIETASLLHMHDYTNMNHWFDWSPRLENMDTMMEILG